MQLNTTLPTNNLLDKAWEFYEWRNHIYTDWNSPSTFLRTWAYVTIETFIGGTLLYFTLASISYLIFFKLFKKKFLPGLDLEKVDPVGEIKWSIYNIAGESALASIIRMFWASHSFLYYDINEYPLWWIPVSWILLLVITEPAVYWVHRWLHEIQWMYDYLHVYHHQFRYVTPFCGFAFHPIDVMILFDSYD